MKTLFVIIITIDISDNKEELASRYIKHARYRRPHDARLRARQFPI